MKNNVSTSIHKCKAIEGRVGKTSDGCYAAVDMDRATLFFESPSDMVDMANLLIKLSEELAEKQKKQDND